MRSDPTTTSRRWDDHWCRHDTQSIPVSKIKVAEELLEPLFDEIRKGNSIRFLDAGCGNGVHVEVIERFLKSEEVNPVLFAGTAIDLSPEAVSATKRRVISDRWTIATGDATHLEFGADSFDVVLSVGMLCCFKNPQAAIQELVRVTKAGGLIAIYTNTTTSTFTRMGLGMARLIGNTLGSGARQTMAWMTAPIIGFLKPGSGVSLRDGGLESSREIASTNLVSPITQFLDRNDLRTWIEASGAVIESENESRPFTAWCRVLEKSQE